MTFTALKPLMDKWTDSSTNFERLARDADNREWVDDPLQGTNLWTLVLSEVTPTVAIGNIHFVYSM